MNVIDFGQKSCEKVRRYLDSYMSNELLIETNHEVLQHLEKCPACSGVLAERVKVRSMLRDALQMDVGGQEFEQRVRKSLEAAGSGQASRLPWFLSAAAMLLVAISIPLLMRFSRADVSNTSALKIGLEDHVHCAVGGNYPEAPPTTREVEASLGPEYSGLIPVMNRLTAYHLRAGHHCRANGRQFVHITLQNAESLLSLVVTEKRAGESLRTGDQPMLQAAFGRYAVAGFATGSHLAFLVSDLDRDSNSREAANVFPGVRSVLVNLERHAEGKIPALALLQRPAERVELQAMAVGPQ